jgi:hypothetical protein
MLEVGLDAPLVVLWPLMRSARSGRVGGDGARYYVRQMMPAQTGQKFVLEVRGMGVVVGEDTDEEIWRAIEKKADNESYRSRKLEDSYG